MKKIDPTIIKETIYVLVWVLGLSVIMQAVFLIIKRWDYTVLTGNVLTGFAVTLNFFLMGLGVQKSLGKEEKEAKKVIRLSQIYRYLILIVFLVIGVVFKCFNNWTVFIPVIFPRIAIAARPLFKNMKWAKQEESQPSTELAKVEEVVENSVNEEEVTNQEEAGEE